LIFAGTVDSVEEEIDASKRSGSSASRALTTPRSPDRHLVAYVYQPDEEHPTVCAATSSRIS